MTTENQYWSDHVRPRLGPFGFLHRVENSAALGTPDVAYCLRSAGDRPAASGWLELKHLDHLPARRSTPVTIKHLTIDQVQFLEAWATAGGRAWLLLRAGDRHLLLTPYFVRQLYEGRLRPPDLVDAATVMAIGAFPTGQILRALTG